MVEPAATSARFPEPTTRQGISVRTYSPKPGEIERQWHIIDASDVVLGRLATHTATLLRGKHKPTFAPHMDTGDFVVIINAGKVALTGNKRQTKVAYRHSGYPGGLKQIGYEELLSKRPEKAIELAVKGMLPHNKLARQIIKKLKVYPGAEHPHAAQQPKPFEITQVAQ
jgi:large subunit ribosomal protein L13